MAIILPPQQWTRQPQYPVKINRSTVFGANAGLVWTAAAGNVNLVDGSMASTVVITSPLVGTPHGLSTSGSGGQNERLEFQGAPTATTFPTTFLSIFRTFSGGNAVNYIKTSASGGGAYLGHDTSHLAYHSGLYLSSPAYLSPAFDDTTYYAFAATYDRGSGLAAGVLKNLQTGATQYATGSFGFDFGAGDGIWQIMPGGGLTKVSNQILAACSFTVSNESQLRNLVNNPWGNLFAPLPRRIFVGPSGAASNDGTLARTNANDTAAASGSQTNTGTLARTNANDTSAASGSQTNTGTLGRTNANDSVSASGDLGTFNGTVAYTNVNDSSAASGTQTNTGTLARTNANDTSAASGTQTNTGTLARTNADDSVAASGSAGTVTGTVSYTNANDRLTAIGGGGQSRGGITRHKETKVKKSSTAVRDLLTETIDPRPAELAHEMREAAFEPEDEKAEAAELVVAQLVPEVEDKEKEVRRIARRRSVMHLLLLDDMSIQSHAEEVKNEAEVKRQALIEDVKTSLKQAIARRKNANG